MVSISKDFREQLRPPLRRRFIYLTLLIALIATVLIAPAYSIGGPETANTAAGFVGIVIAAVGIVVSLVPLSTTWKPEYKQDREELRESYQEAVNYLIENGSISDDHPNYDNLATVLKVAFGEVNLQIDWEENPNIILEGEGGGTFQMRDVAADNQKLEIPDGKGGTRLFDERTGFQQALGNAVNKYDNTIENSRDRREIHFNFLGLYSSALGLTIATLSLTLKTTMLPIVG